MPELLSRRNLIQLIGSGTLLSATRLRGQTSPAEAATQPNQPIGVGQGVYPGRVVWTRDQKAARWGGSGAGHWWEDRSTDETAVDSMMSNAIRQLGGQSADAAAWDALFKNFNQSRGNGEVGYTKGEKIFVKANFVGFLFIEKNVDAESYDLVGRPDYMNTSPQMIMAILRQLVEKVGADQKDISVGDSLALFPNQFYDICRREFPDVVYMDRFGGNERHPRTRMVVSSVPFYWSRRPAQATQDYVPAAYVDAKYLINLANLKSHTMGGVTLCAKNHFGSLCRRPPERGYLDMHGSLAERAPAAGSYRSLVDLMGHAHIGGKTVLYMVDGLYPGVHPIEASPRKWGSAPFNGNWASSLFVSQDGVAIDSVGFDFLYNEWTDYPRMPAADDYLREAALAGNPPSGTFYDPDHATNTTRLASLGVHEHWNNVKEKKVLAQPGQERRNRAGRLAVARGAIVCRRCFPLLAGFIR